jgi:hypothetical protein
MPQILSVLARQVGLVTAVLLSIQMVQAFLAILLLVPEDVPLESIRFGSQYPVLLWIEKNANTAKVYVVNATGAEDVQAAVRFAKAKNIALVIKNTGHSYTGRSVSLESIVKSIKV